MIPKGRYKKQHEMSTPKKKEKKFTEAVNYKKGVVSTDHPQIKELVDRAEVIYMKSQKVYDDGSQSLTLEIHFQPKK